MKVHIETFGCQMNKLDSELVLGDLLGNGFELAASVRTADVVLFNTCSVRQHAEEKVYSRLGALKALKQQKPDLLIGVIGCMAQNERDRIFARAPHVDLVCGTFEIAELPTILRSMAEERSRLLRVEEHAVVFGPRRASARPLSHQAFVLITRGCDNYCSYCIVPYVRGREQSRPMPEIITECESLVSDGVREITLLGQNVDSYGKSLKDGSCLAGLLRAVNKVDELKRIRFVTSHPKDISIDLLEAMAELPKVCRHIHMPAQSGSDRILKAMHRGYTAARYREIIAEARRLMPDIQIASDFIVGFPGETDEDFEETARLLREVRFQNCFIFKYSPRPGTRAARWADDVPAKEKSRRNQVLLAIQEEVSRARNASLTGSTLSVLVDGPSKSNPRRLSGRSAGNDIVIFDGPGELAGRVVSVRITGSTPLSLFGEGV